MVGDNLVLTANKIHCAGTNQKKFEAKTLYSLQLAKTSVVTSKFLYTKAFHEVAAF